MVNSEWGVVIHLNALLPAHHSLLTAQLKNALIINYKK